MMKPLSRSVRAQAGQALTEFLISLLALVPLFFAIAMLGKYLDIKSTVIQGARYAAWERTVWYGDSNSSRTNSKDAATVRNEIRERLFSAVDTPLLADDGVTRTNLRAQVNKLWVDHTGTAILPVYADTTAVAATSTHAGDPGAMGAGLDVLLTAVGTAGNLGNFGSGGFKPNINGLYTAQVQARLAAAPRMLRGFSFTTVAMDGSEDNAAALVFGAGAGAKFGTNVLLADAWSSGRPESSSDAASVHNQVSGLVPTSWTAARAAMILLAGKPALDRISVAGALLDPGKIDVEVIPPDRRK